MRARIRWRTMNHPMNLNYSMKLQIADETWHTIALCWFA